EQTLPARGFDLVTAIDVFEHLRHPGAAIARLGAALRPGGLMVWNDCTSPDPERPMHIVDSAYPMLRALRKSGFRGAPGVGGAPRPGGHRARARGGAGPAANALGGPSDALRSGAPGRLASHALGTLSARRRARARA